MPENIKDIFRGISFMPRLIKDMNFGIKDMFGKIQKTLVPNPQKRLSTGFDPQAKPHGYKPEKQLPTIPHNRNELFYASIRVVRA